MNRTLHIRQGEFSGRCVLYWMVRDKRVRDNWALLEAQRIAIKNKVPLIVCFNYFNTYKDANIRQYQFLFDGLKEVHRDLIKLQIGFRLLEGLSIIEIPKFIEKHNVGHLVTDFTPLNIYRSRLSKVVNKIDIPVTQVDTHNIIPVWKASVKKEYAAYTIRPKIKRLLADFLTEIPEIKRHPIELKSENIEINWNKRIDDLDINLKIKPVEWIKPGEEEANRLMNNLKTNLIGYNDNRNDPTLNKLSNISPYFHYGHISPHRVALEISKSAIPEDDKESFLEEMIIRRELADNFCYYEKNYDHFDGFHDWAKKTLNEHRNDEREYVYSSEQFDAGETHDNLWNAAQNEMKKKGKMHGFMSMY